MPRSLTTVGVLMVLCLAISSCWASEAEESDAEATRVRGAVWVLPPAYEFPVSGGGHLSLEIGATPALWPEGAQLGDLFGPRVGVFVYPAGELEGLALHAALGNIREAVFAEVGIWGVWRAGDASSGSSRGLSFRLGVGAIGVGSIGGVGGASPVFGAAAGFSF